VVGALPASTRDPPTTHRPKEIVMNTRTLIASAVFAFAASGAALAQEATSDQWMNAVSTKSRDQVNAELIQARADGSIKVTSAGYLPSVKVSRDRADVVSETKAALRNGEIDRIGAEAYAFQLPAHGGNVVRVAQSSR
jgi:uncharacterized protein YdbL (DUF1318 family)